MAGLRSCADLQRAHHHSRAARRRGRFHERSLNARGFGAFRCSASAWLLVLGGPTPLHSIAQAAVA
eukprot:9770282-Lingulodinium_polyedra.AAC.1